MLFGMLGPETLLPVALIVLVLFGGTKIPELAKSLGRAKKEFEKGVREGGEKTEPAPPEPKEEPKAR